MSLIPFADGYIVDAGDITPACHMNKEFHEYEAETERQYRELTGRGSRAVKYEFIVNRENEARRRWCGACPLIESCYQWGVLEGQKDDNKGAMFTGIVAGEFLIEGQPLLGAEGEAA